MTELVLSEGLLSEAIDHAKQVADSYRDTVPDCSCAVEHRQLVGWLRELLDLRDSHKALLVRAEEAESAVERVRALLPVMQKHFEDVRPWDKNTAVQIRIDINRIREALGQLPAPAADDTGGCDG